MNTFLNWLPTIMLYSAVIMVSIYIHFNYLKDEKGREAFLKSLWEGMKNTSHAENLRNLGYDLDKDTSDQSKRN
ncbi:hypothetical protein [Vibrio penaeicida]|uniref:Uncharacterized protein n=1 Tax=Vibrio penaeicida TaxID=104609 RepID=A0AAV5NTL1_9VIBR|nr:hypothetical protein [Vibrio penaeicida]RTZ20939.1 hypothetical protein EKN09_22060 [Vibrio penaeicida]GLQ73960.1 hypothetical protein GCM10007932_33200 [Vibrio penaeicida]